MAECITNFRGRGRGRGRPATRRTSVNIRVTRQGGSVSKKKTSPEAAVDDTSQMRINRVLPRPKISTLPLSTELKGKVSVRETRSPVVSKEKSRKATKVPQKRKAVNVNARPYTRSISNLMKPDDHKT